MSQTTQRAEQIQYKLERITDRFQDEAILELWRSYLDQSGSAEKIYQAPEYFSFLMETRDAGDEPELFMLSRAGDNQPVGIVPVRNRSGLLDFRIGDKDLGLASIDG